MQPRSADKSWDLWAIGFSTACVLHCLAPVLFIAVLPSALLSSGSHEVHLLMVLLATPISLYVAWHERTGNPQSTLFRLAVLIGLLLLISAATVAATESLETTLTLSGGLLLASAHFWRRWYSPNHCEPPDSAASGTVAALTHPTRTGRD